MTFSQVSIKELFFNKHYTMYADAILYANKMLYFRASQPAALETILHSLG